MATKKKTKNAADQLPEGFEPVQSSMDGFFIVEEGNQIQGILKDSFTVRSKFGEKRVFKIQVTANDPPTRIVNKDDGEMNAEEGSMVGLDEKGYLKKLGDLAKGTEIFVRCIGREEVSRIKGQQPAWRFAVGAIKRNDEDDGKNPF